VTQRGEGIGLEVTNSVVRGVRLAPSEPGRVAAAAEAPIRRFDDEAAVLDALVRVRGQLGEVAATTRAAWFPLGSTMQRIDATGCTGPELNAMRQELADRTGITSTMLTEAEARRWMLVLRWDHLAALRLEQLVERAGFVDVSVEPAPVALGRALGITTPVARRDASSGESWVAVFEAHVPIAATSVPHASREHPGVVIASEATALHRLEEVLDAPALADLLDEIAATAIAATGKKGELDLRLVLAGDPYPPFPAHDLRAPQRQAVALGAAAGAAGLTGRLRPVDFLTPTGEARSSDIRRPWAIERVVDLPPRERARRAPWWRRVGPLTQSRSRKRGRSPKTATAWRSGTRSRR
jgi:hypothetical protein